MSLSVDNQNQSDPNASIKGFLSISGSSCCMILIFLMIILGFYQTYSRSKNAFEFGIGFGNAITRK